MEKIKIENNEYVVGTKAIGLEISTLELPREVEIDGQKLILKSSFHVTLVAYGEILRKHNLVMPGFKEGVLNDFQEFLKNNPISFGIIRINFICTVASKGCSFIFSRR